MDIELWLNNLDLSEYISVFKDESIDMEVLLELTSDDLKEIGISKLGHRKIILKAISEIQKEPNNKSLDKNHKTDELSSLCELLPNVISSPLKEYIYETNPGMKLWFACDTAELLIRFFVILGISDLKDNNKLDNTILKEFWGKIEMPTLGAWMAMAKSLDENKDKSGLLVPEIYEFIRGPLTNLMYGPDKPGTTDTSFLALRNRLAHGGGLNTKEASRLLNNWKNKFEDCLNKLSWISDIKLCGVKSGEFINLNNEKLAIGEIDNIKEIKNTDMSSDSVFVFRNNNFINLWPLILFGTPQTSTTKQNLNKDPVTQIYVRKDVVRLQFTPLDAEGYSQTEKGEDAINAFKALFSFDFKTKEIHKVFEIQDFIKEINRDASQMVGRFEDQNKIEKTINSINEGLIWLTGPPGIGKSFLSARLMRDLEENNKNTDTCVLSYRFKIGDNTRCSRESFVDFIKERLIAYNVLGSDKINYKAQATDKLKSCFNNLKKEKKIIIVLDGLDEINVRDKEFTKDIPTSLNYPNLIWVCFGRPEPSLEYLFHLNNALMPFPDGLPSMSSNDIRGMIMEKIGPLKKKLLLQDKENSGTIVNPFIDLVVEKADGLPLYVKYVIGDVLANRFRVLDGDEVLPESLHAYHEQLLNGLGIGDLKFILTPLAALLAVAYEPLSLEEIESIFIYRKIIPKNENGKKLIENGLSAIAPMIRRAPDPQGEEGYTLFHFSLREHILKSSDMFNSVKTAKEAFCELALKPDQIPNLTNYLYRTGIDHFIDEGELKKAGKALINLNWLHSLFNLGKTASDINGYWSRLPITSNQIDAQYLKVLNAEYIYPGGIFGDGEAWLNFFIDEIDEVNESERFGRIPPEEAATFDKECKEMTLEFEELLGMDPNIDDDDELFNDLLGIDSTELSDSAKNLNDKNYESYFKTSAKDQGYVDEIHKTKNILNFYYELAELFLIGRFCHSGAEICQRICRFLLAESRLVETDTVLAHSLLSNFYALWNGHKPDGEINKDHLFYNPKNGTRHLQVMEKITNRQSTMAPDLFRCCLILICKNSLKSPYLSKLLTNPCIMREDVKSLNIKNGTQIITNISELLKSLYKVTKNEKGKNHPLTLEVELSLANRLYYDMKLLDAYEIINGVYNSFLKNIGFNNLKTIEALDRKGNIELELGQFKDAKVTFETLIKKTSVNFSTPSILIEWKAKLSIIELAFNNTKNVKKLCEEGLVYFDNDKTSEYTSIYNDRTFVTIRVILNDINNGLEVPKLSTKPTDKEIEKIINFYYERGMYEVCLFYLNLRDNDKTSKIREILNFIRTLRLSSSMELTRGLAKMSARKERIFRMRYNLGMNSSHSLEEISKQFEVSCDEVKDQLIEGFIKLNLI